MKALIQRVSSASVTVDGKIVGQIERGILLLCGFGNNDNSDAPRPMAEKIANLRIFPDERGRFHFSLKDIEGGILIVPQFTLYGDTAKGRRPEFFNALAPEKAEPLFQELTQTFRQLDIAKVEAGIFGADMKVALVNDGPVTLMLEA